MAWMASELSKHNSEAERSADERKKDFGFSKLSRQTTFFFIFHVQIVIVIKRDSGAGQVLRGKATCSNAIDKFWQRFVK